MQRKHKLHKNDCAVSLNNLRIMRKILFGSLINSPIRPASSYENRMTDRNIPESMHLNPEIYKKGLGIHFNMEAYIYS